MTYSYNFLGLICDDVPASTRYYADVLGFEVNEARSIPGYYSQFVTKDGAMFALVAGFGVEQALDQKFDTAFEVDDVDATFSEWKENGVEMVTDVIEMPFGRTFLARTPDNHVLRVLQVSA
ncbi:MAG: VOC family protein [Candidatus Promineifilaceae bacterium]